MRVRNYLLLKIAATQSYHVVSIVIIMRTIIFELEKE